MSVQLLDVKELADLLKCCERKARDLPIPFSRAGRKRLYNMRDVHKYLEDRKCLSPSAKVLRTGKRSSSSKGIGLLEALEHDPGGKRSNSNVSLKSKRAAS